MDAKLLNSIASEHTYHSTGGSWNKNKLYIFFRFNQNLNFFNKKIFQKNNFFNMFHDQTCRNPGSWMHIHTCQRSDSYLSEVRFILVRGPIHTCQTCQNLLGSPAIQSTTCHHHKNNEILTIFRVGNDHIENFPPAAGSLPGRLLKP